MRIHLSLLLLLTWLPSSSARALTFREAQFDLVVHPGIPHASVPVAVFTNGTAYGGGLTVQSDAPWVTPSWDAESRAIVLRFSATNLLKTATATLRAVIPGETNEFYVHANLAPPQVVRMIADPQRPRLYALHQAGVGRGSLIVLDSTTGRPLESRTLGNRPTDLVVDVARSELLVLQTVDLNLAVFALPSLEPKPNVNLPEFPNWGAEATDGNLALGPGNVLYYSDGSWAPALYVWNRVSGQILQRVNIDSNGFGGFAVSPDGHSLIGWAQYGWSAGWGGSYIARYDVAVDGTLVWRENTNSQWPTVIVRDPFDAPVLFDNTASRVFVKQLAVDAGAITGTLQSFASTVYAISPGGEIVCTANALVHAATGNQLVLFPGIAVQPVITPDYTRLVYFDATARSFVSVDLVTEVGPKILGLEPYPLDGAVTTTPTRLSWVPMTGATGYRVYWGTDRDRVNAAGPGSPEYRGDTVLPRWTDSLPGEPGRTYFWRVDAAVDGVSVPGPVHSFTVSALEISLSKLQGITLAGLRSEVVFFDVSSSTAGTAWEATSPEPWISFVTNRGVTPARVRVIVDASQIGVGTHVGTVRVGTSPETLAPVPFQVRVDPLFVTVIQSDPGSALAYAISEDTQAAVPKAQLLEIDTESEQILRRVEVGSSATDLAIHKAEGRIYVVNWRTGALLAVSRSRFEVERTYPFSPFGGVGTSNGDAYRVAAGRAGRVVVEEADQWVDISLFDTVNGTTVQRAGVREGGGRFDPTGRYYYHGENNSSGATIQRYDTAGDTFALLASVRVESASYYGSRVVTVSEDGGRVFWNGSVFDATLKELWSFGEHVYACTVDGRYAFSQDKIFDINRRVQVLQMPLSTAVSAYNGASRKLLVQQEGALRFYALDPEAVVLPTPELSAASVEADRVQLSWVDRSLEMAFVLQMRTVGSESWTDLPSLAANVRTFIASGLQPTTAYQFRVRATAGTLSSSWSETLTVTTPGLPPTPPVLAMPMASFRGVQLSWSNPERETGFLLERRTNAAAWIPVPLPADTTGFFDTNVIPGGSYQYRLSATNQWAATGPQAFEQVLVPFPSPPAQPRPLSLRMLPELQVRIDWQPVLEVERYKVERLAPGAVEWAPLADVSAQTLQWVDTVTELGKPYAYRLIAANVYGSSDPSSPMTIVPERIGRLLADDFEAGISPITWESVTGAQVRADGPEFETRNALWFGLGEARGATSVPVPLGSGSTLEFSLRTAERSRTNSLWDPAEPGEGVMVEYSLNGAIWFSFGFVELSTLEPAGSWVRLPVALPPQAASAGTRIRLRQLNHSGHSQDTWAIDDVALVGPIIAVPGAPAWVMSTTSSSTSIELAWDRVALTTAYRVERYAGKEGWITLGTVPARQPWFTDRQAVPGATFRYQVRALLGPQESAPSRSVLGETISQAAEWSLQETGIALEAAGALPEAQLVRYAFNLGWDAPLTSYPPGSVRAGLPQIQIDPASGAAGLRFLRRKASMNPGVEYLPEMSADLTNWLPCGEPRVVEPVDTLWEAVHVMESGPSVPSRFFRVRVRALP